MSTQKPTFMERLVKRSLLAIPIAGISLATFGASRAEPPRTSADCDVSGISSARRLDETLNRRAVDVVRRSMSRGWATDALLSRSIAANAPVSLGAGDVGRPLGEGPAGMRSLAVQMRADGYRYLGWDYMDNRVQPCGSQKSTVEFIDSADHTTSKVEFSFEQGRIVAVSGWLRSFVAGSLR